MSTVTKTPAALKSFGGVPFGNLTGLAFSLPLAAGILAASNQATALAIGDVVRLGVIPAGTLLVDVQTIISAAFTATSTFSVGFQYVDGVDSTVVPQNAAYFFAALAATVSVSGKNATTAPVTLPKDAYLIVTNQVAAQAATSQLDIVVIGVQTGAN